MFWPNSLDNSLQPQPYPWGDKNWSVLAGLREASGWPQMTVSRTQFCLMHEGTDGKLEKLFIENINK